jgi:hypothetical protein
MPFSPRESVVGIAGGILGNALAIVLGVVVPLAHPSRNQVDNALVFLGMIGVLITLLLPRSGMTAGGGATRGALGAYGATSLIAVALADFGSMRAIGWMVKVAAAALFALALRGLAPRA